MDARDLTDIPGFRPVARGGPRQSVLELGSNENPLGPSPRAVEAVQTAALDMHRYPRDPHAALDRALAEHWSVATDQVWVCAGAVGVIDCLSRAFLEPGDGILRADPGFSYFGRSARYHHAEEATYPLDPEDGFSLDPAVVLSHYDGERLVYIVTPHNPTGALAEMEAIEAIAAGTEPDTLVVVDEAYGAFTDESSAIDLVRERDDVAVVRTFSKAYGLAGIRLGYALVPSSIADAYAHVLSPFGASGLACVAGRAALEDDAYLERSIAVARDGRAFLHETIDAPTWPSQGNFVLVDVGDAASASERLLEAGVRVRDCTGFGLPDCVRITVGTSAQTRRVARIVNEVVA